LELSSVHWAWFVGAALLMFSNFAVTIGLIRDGGATPLQKSVQAMVIWLVPFVGAGLILALIGSHHSRAEVKSMVPFPFYLAAYQKPDAGSTSSFGEGTCSIDGTCGGCDSD